MNPKTRPPLLAILAVLCAAALVIALAANCKPGEPAVSPTLSPTPTPPPTSTPIPTWTPTPTPVPAPQLPVLAGTPVPLPRAPITPENAADVVELSLWGKGEIHRIAYSPDGRLLAIGSESGLWLYDAETLELARFIETSLWVDTFDFTPDGATIIAGLGASTVASWDVATGERLTNLKVRESVGHPRGSGPFSVHGAMLAAESESSPTINLWDVDKGELLHTLEGHTHPVRSLAFSPDGSLLTSGGTDDLVILWDARAGTRLLTLEVTLEGPADKISALAFSPDGALLASNSAGGTYLWEVETGTLLQTVEGWFDSVTSQPFSPDSTLLALESKKNYTTQIWNVETGQVVRTLNGSKSARGITFSPDGTTLVMGAWWDEDVRLWDVETATLAHTLEGSSRSLGGPIISPDGTVFVSHDNTIEQLDLKTGRVVRTLEGHTSNAGNLALSADGTTLASSETWDLAVWIWDVDTGAARRFPGPYATFVRDIALSPDGGMFAASSDSTTFFVYDTRSGERIHALGDGRSCDFTFSADGTRLLSAASEGIYMWSVVTGEQLYEFEPPGHYSRSGIALSPDGALAAIGGAKGTIRLYDTTNGQLVRSLEGATGRIHSLAFSPGGTLLATAGRDRIVRLWDVRTGTLLKSLEGHTAGAGSLSFSADGAVLGSGGNDGTVRLWGVPPTD